MKPTVNSIGRDTAPAISSFMYQRAPGNLFNNRSFYNYLELLANNIDTFPVSQPVTQIYFDLKRSTKREEGHYFLRPSYSSRFGEITRPGQTTYSVAINPIFSYQDTLIIGVQAKQGQEWSYQESHCVSNKNI